MEHFFDTLATRWASWNIARKTPCAEAQMRTRQRDYSRFSLMAHMAHSRGACAWLEERQHINSGRGLLPTSKALLISLVPTDAGDANIDVPTGNLYYARRRHRADGTRQE